MSIVPGLTHVILPENITVHLGRPDEEAENVTVPFIDYIKNVASSELYPTWPENALIANIYAITSIALNRIFTQWYRSRGYNFDITNTTQYDQAYVHNRGIFDNISSIVDKIFSHYIRRQGRIEPFYAQFCDGRISQCDGMYQWGSVDLANQGYSPLEILQYYYGSDIEIVTDAIRQDFTTIYRGEPLSLGDTGLDVMIMQFALNRISNNFPAIPKIYTINGVFDEVTESAVREFQKIFNLEANGIIDQGTWYKVRSIYNAVTKIAELASAAPLYADISRYFEAVLIEGFEGPRVQLLQYFLNVLSTFYSAIPSVDINGYFGPETREAVMEFQKVMNLPVSGLIDDATWDAMYNAILSILVTLPPESVMLPSFKYPGIIFTRGMGTEQPGVLIIQELLAYISSRIPEITYVPYNLVDGVFGPITESAVITFQEYFGLEPTGIVDETTWLKLVEVYRELRYSGNVNNNTNGTNKNI